MGFIDDNNNERLKFVDRWSKHVLETDDKTWSMRQNMLINSCIRSAHMTRKEYLEMKGE